jgi:VID27 C-terminal WD40-like domain
MQRRKTRSKAPWLVCLILGSIDQALTEYAEEEEETEDESDVEAPDWGPKKKAKNSGLAVGHKGIAVVLRGDQLGIFRETTDGKLELGGTVNEIKGPGRNGKSFEPNKVSTIYTSRVTSN